MRSQTAVLHKRTSLHYIKEHSFSLLLSVLKWKDKSSGAERERCQGRCRSQDSCCRCLSHSLTAFPLFSETIDEKFVQTRFPEFICCTLLNFSLLSSLNEEVLHSKPLLLLQSNTLTFRSSFVAEERFLSLKSSCRSMGNNPGSPCLSAPHTGLVWGGSAALFPRALLSVQSHLN